MPEQQRKPEQLRRTQQPLVPEQQREQQQPERERERERELPLSYRKQPKRPQQ